MIERSSRLGGFTLETASRSFGVEKSIDRSIENAKTQR